jgi:hypothetical protein
VSPVQTGGNVAQPREMLNWCIMNPLESDSLAADDPQK